MAQPKAKSEAKIDYQPSNTLIPIRLTPTPAAKRKGEESRKALTVEEYFSMTHGKGALYQPDPVLEVSLAQEGISPPEAEAPATTQTPPAAQAPAAKPEDGQVPEVTQI